MIRLFGVVLSVVTLAVCSSTATAQRRAFGAARNAQGTKTVGLIQRKSGVSPGYTMFSPRHSQTTYLIDEQGELVHSWKNDRNLLDAKLLPDGKLLRSVNLRDFRYRGIPGPHGEIQVVNWDGSVAWRYRHVSDSEVLHHDVVPMPNGNFLMSVHNAISREDAIALGRDPDTLPKGRLFAERVIEVEPRGRSGGKIVWSWSVWDHLVQDRDPKKPNYGKPSDHPDRINLNYVRRPTEDWNHVSGLDYNAELDLVMLTFHGHDEIFIIDHSTTTAEAKTHLGGRHGKGGGILYRWGNPQTYGGSPDLRRYFAIHNAHWIPKGLPNAGKVLVYSNQYAGPNSSVEMVEIPMRNERFVMRDPRRPETQPKFTVLYDRFHSRNMGGAQQLPNGNVLIDDAVHGRFIEINSAKQVVWEYINPVTTSGPVAQGASVGSNRRGGDGKNECFRAFRYAPDYEGLAGKDLTPQGVIELAGPTAANLSETMLVLSPDIQKKYDTIQSYFEAKRSEVVQNARGNVRSIIQGMRQMRQEQDKAVRKILTDEQFDIHQTLMNQQRSERRGNARNE